MHRRLPDHDEDRQGRGQERRASHQEDRPHAVEVGADPAHERAERGAQRHRRAHHPERPAHALSRRVGRHQRRRRGHGPRAGALEQPQQHELNRRLADTHQGDRQAASDHRPKQHRAAAVTVGQEAPEGAGDRLGEPGGPAGQPRPEGEVMGSPHAQVLQEEGEEGECEGEAEDGRELREPERGQVPPPVDGHVPTNGRAARTTAGA